MLAMGCGVTGAHAAPVADAAAAVSRVVQGIVSYTRWPTPPAPFRLCVVGQTDYADGLLQSGLQIDEVQLRAQRMAIDDNRLGAECDVVYSGALTESERTILRTDLTGHPVLTISEHDPSCSDSNAFCLAVHGTTVSFSVNLDSIARSGVRVDPHVLLLGRQPRPTP
ncbi:YfiR family protein [Acidisphaera sp. S103]|uniref:YfiR family protein n=1 Tax=Acidisphaera sp. S103 TaxID=1747223 RepID=UPI001C20BA55|nr:YfiR family protein [Acidisphaera sp. S103]